jgi:phage-related minor tail protein
MQAAPGNAMPAQAQQPMTPPQQNLVAPSSNDPLVQRRNANAQANAEYRASKKASKAELKAQSQQAKAQYKEEVQNAKINRKADKDAAKAELNATEQGTPKDKGVQH